MSTTLGDKLKALRAERDWTQQELAGRSGVKRGYLASIEAGLVANPSASVFLKLSSAFNVPLDELHEAAGYVTRTAEPRRIVETHEDILERLKAVQPASIPLYTWEDYPYAAGKQANPVDYIFRARRRALGRKLEAYVISGKQWEPLVGDRDIIVVDRDGKLDNGITIACRLGGVPTLGKLRDVNGTVYIETANRKVRFETSEMPAPVIEVRRYLIRRPD